MRIRPCFTWGLSLVCECALAVAVSCFAPPGPVLAQAIVPPATTGVPYSRAVPGFTYYAVFGDFYDGQFQQALKGFRNEGRGGVKTVDSRWIDSICYHAMTGECLYQLGQLDAAVEHYSSALKLYLAFPDWMIRVQFSPTVLPSAARRGAPWGQSTRGAILGGYPDRIEIAQGKLDNTQAYTRGGVVERPMYYPIDVVEIVRCTALALRRYHELLGPVAAQDGLAKQMVLALSRRPGPANHWSECWIDVQLGLAQLAAGKIDQAKTALGRGLVAQGQFDHPLTAVALLELGRISRSEGDLAQAAKFFEEATYAAYFYPANRPDVTVIEEALREGLSIHLQTNQAGIYPPLPAVAAWARTADFRHLAVSTLVMAAENHAFEGRAAQAMPLLNEARSLAGRRDMVLARTGARLNYAAAVALYAGGDDSGAQPLADALAFQTQGTTTRLRVALVDGWLNGGAITPRAAAELYELLLADPTGDDWNRDPLDALARLMLPLEASLENWFEAVLSRKEHAAAFVIADQIRRRRFLATQELGGRVLALRSVLSGATEELPIAAELERQNLALRFPEFDELEQRSAALRRALLAAPPTAGDAAAEAALSKQVAEWAGVAERQEKLLRAMAVRREPCSMVTPPLLTLAEVQERLVPEQSLLSFLSTSGKTYGFLVRRDKVQIWPIENSTGLGRRVAKLLRELGLVEGNRAVSQNLLSNEEWQKPAADLWATLLHSSRADVPGDAKEIVIVPDGALWYLPFEMLPASSGAEAELLVESCRVRYAPTCGWAVRLASRAKETNRTGVVWGRLHPRQAAEWAEREREPFGEAVGNCVSIDGQHPTPSAAYAGLFDRLVVFDDCEAADPWELAPLAAQRETRGASLADWLRLPGSAPSTVVLPAFHTTAENSLKRGDSVRLGDDLFLPVCGLLASGVETALVSRWRPGGQSSVELVREFLQEQESGSAGEAWQRAVFMAMDRPIDVENEPRVEPAKDHEPPTARHPFLWGAFALIDRGPLVAEARRWATAAPLSPGAAEPRRAANRAERSADEENVAGAAEPEAEDDLPAVGNADVEAGDDGSGEDASVPERPAPRKRVPRGGG